jgi:hypothetical protein
VEQARANAAAADVVLNDEFDAGVRWIYDHYFSEAIHPRW